MVDYYSLYEHYPGTYPPKEAVHRAIEKYVKIMAVEERLKGHEPDEKKIRQRASYKILLEMACMKHPQIEEMRTEIGEKIKVDGG